MSKRIFNTEGVTSPSPAPLSNLARLSAMLTNASRITARIIRTLLTPPSASYSTGEVLHDQRGLAAHVKRSSNLIAGSSSYESVKRGGGAGEEEGGGCDTGSRIRDEPDLKQGVAVEGQREVSSYPGTRRALGTVRFGQ